MLLSNQSVQEALVHIQLPGQSVLAEHGNEVRLIKASQLHRFSSDNRGTIKLKDLPLESSEAVYQASDDEAKQFLLHAKGYQLSGDPYGLIKNLRQRLVLVRDAGMNFLISASEENLVDYHCDPSNHPWSPPPPWTEKTKCWCGNPVKRDG